MDARMAHLEGAYDQINHRLGSMDGRLESLDQRFGQVDARFAQMDQKMDHHFQWLMGMLIVAIVLPAVGRLFGH